MLIPKLGKDITKTNSWQPINLINFIGKLGDKVIADRLQETDLLHHMWFGSVKGRSAIEVVYRAVVWSRHCMDSVGAVGWGF